MIKTLLHSTRRLLRMLLSSLLGAFVVILIIAVIHLNNQPELSVWHTTILDEEFRANSGLTRFSEYLELEDRLFDQLEKEVYQKVPPQEQRRTNRYFHGSMSDPGRWPTNWNRTFVFPTPNPSFGVLLIHGMSDSPYSVRSLGQALQAKGGSVVGLRVPGHGQAPSGLLTVRWEDMAAAVKLAARHVKDEAGKQPFYIVGYSNGGALAVNYTLDTLADSTLARPDGLVLLSPEIGLSKIAFLATWQDWIGRILGLRNLSWNSVLPEYDPWKYGSFTINAARQAYQITQAVQAQITRQAKAGTLDQMPPILAFQSVVDATIAAPDLVSNLFARLPGDADSSANQSDAKHELVLFDINRITYFEPLMEANSTDWIEPMLANPDLDFMLTLVRNRNPASDSLVAVSRVPGSAQVESCDIDLSWPRGVYSLTHVALPFPANDPIYGGPDAEPSPGIQLGNLALRGERNVIQVPAADMLRLRYNPFHAYLEERMLEFMQLIPNTDFACVQQ